MASHSFQLPHRASRTQIRSLGRDRKRKRGTSDAFDTGFEETYEDVVVEQQLPASPGRLITGLTASQALQYRTAGLQPHEDVPPKPFPHGPVGWTKSKRGQKTRTHFEGESDKEILAVDRPTDENTSLRQQHLKVLTAIMHRCLLEGDYERAGKAWSLLLHSNPPMDLRRHDRWGIGAEVLMRKVDLDSRGNGNTDSDGDVDSDDHGHELPFKQNTSYGEDGLRAARAYYDMLIRRFPGELSSNTTRKLPNAVDFNPIMLNVWLYQVAFVRKKALQELEASLDSQSSRANNDDQPTESIDEESRNRVRKDRLEKLRVNELREAELIAAKLNELFASPAYDRDLHLRHLYDMVKVWIEDLKDGEEAQHEPNMSPTQPQEAVEGED